jgi:hypothetical protein
LRREEIVRFVDIGGIVERVMMFKATFNNISVISWGGIVD